LARSLIVTILGDASQFGAELDKAAGKTRSMGRAAGVAGLAIAGGLAYGLEKSVKSAMDAQVSTARLDQAFKQSGESAGKYAGQIDTAEASGRNLGFQNTDLRESLGSLEIATHNHTKAIKDLGVAEDLARFKHIGLADATKVLTTAMAGSQRGAHMLGITIPTVTASVDDVNRAFKVHTSEAYKLAKANAAVIDKQQQAKEVIAAVTDKVHGQADAFSGTAAGGMARFHAQTEQIQESLGQVLLPVVVAVTGKIADMAAWLSKHETVAKIVVVAIGLLATALIGLSVAVKVVTVANFAMDASLGPIILTVGAVVVALALLGVAIYEIVKHWNVIKAATIETWNAIKNAVTNAWHDIENVFVTGWNRIKDVFDAGINFVKDHWRDFAVALAAIITGPLGALVVFIATHWDQIKGDAEAAWDAIKGAVSRAWDKIGNVVNDGVDTVVGFVKALPGRIEGVLGSLASVGLALGKSLVTGILHGLAGLEHALYEELKSAISGALNSVKSFFGIGSPSRVFAEQIGSPLAQGIIQGFQDGAMTMGDVFSGAIDAATMPWKGPASQLAPTPLPGPSRTVSVQVGPVYGTVDAAFARNLRDELVAIGRLEPNIFGGFA
jgi:phage-related protein